MLSSGTSGCTAKQQNIRTFSAETQQSRESSTILTLFFVFLYNDARAGLGVSTRPTRMWEHGSLSKQYAVVNVKKVFVL